MFCFLVSGTKLKQYQSHHSKNFYGNVRILGIVQITLIDGKSLFHSENKLHVIVVFVRYAFSYPDEAHTVTEKQYMPLHYLF